MLLRLSNIGKIQAVTQWIEDYIATGKKLVVFCTFVKDVLNPLYKKFEKISVRLAGDTNKKKRQEYVDKFDKDPNCKIFFAQLKAGGVGLNLVAADTTLHCGLAYNPQLHDQARDRVNRIGQKSSNVNMYYAIAKDTAEEPLIDILDEKRAISDKVIDGEENMVSISVRDELRKRVLGEGRYPLFT